MAMVEIPISYAQANKKFSVSLDGVRYVLKLRWNARASFWSLSIFTTSGEGIITGIPVVANFDLLLSWRGKIASCPPGKLIAVASDGSNETPGRYDLGNGRRVRLLYEPAVQS